MNLRDSKSEMATDSPLLWSRERQQKLLLLTTLAAIPTENNDLRVLP